MNLREVPTGPPEPEPSQVFGPPIETADGTTVIPVARARGAAKPLGVFVVKDGQATWQPAIDAERIALAGILVGLVSATLAGVAMVRRPPWPDLRNGLPLLR